MNHFSTTRGQQSTAISLLFSPLTFSLSISSGEGEGAQVKDDALQPQHVGVGPLLLPSVSFPDGPRWQPGASNTFRPHARSQRRDGGPWQGGVQPGLRGAHGLVSGAFFVSSIARLISSFHLLCFIYFIAPSFTVALLF